MTLLDEIAAERDRLEALPAQLADFWGRHQLWYYVQTWSRLLEDCNQVLSGGSDLATVLALRKRLRDFEG